MSYASEKLYKGYLRRQMPVIVSNVKVREIIVHLPCLTDHDRETIEAKRETNGNFDGMVLLLDCLKRRENWPEQLIDALEACEQRTIAADIRAEYNALRGINNSNPSQPSTTVVSAHVHPPPSASQLPIPESGEKSTSTAAPSPEPMQPQASHKPPAVSLPEAIPEPPESAEIPSTPPPSPEIQHTPVPAQRQVNAHQEPEENSESDIQDITGDAGVIAEQVDEGVVRSVVTPPPPRPIEQSESDSLPSDALQTITEARPPTQTQSNVTNRALFLTMTPEKPPVQDTTAPVVKVAAVLEPEEVSEPQTARVVESSHLLLTDEFLSKPNQLLSYQPQNVASPNTPAVNSVVEPYSGNSERLEISDGAPDTVASVWAPACSDVTSTISDTVSGVPCQDNGIALNHNEPQENHYESQSWSLEMQEVCEHVMHISQEVSILNLDGQTSAPQAQTFNSDTTEEINSESAFSTTGDTASTVKAHSIEKYHPSDPAPPTTSPHEEEASHNLTNNTKYILMAAGVGVFAALVAWKLKN